MHYIHRVFNFILIIVSLSKPKDLAIAFLFGLELQLQKSVPEDTKVLQYAPCLHSSVQISQKHYGI